MSGGLTYDWNGHTDMEVSSPHLTDMEVAGKVRMLMRDQLNHEAVCVMARDRIMGLSKQADKRRALVATLVEALEQISSVCSDRSDKSNWRLDYISDKANTALAAAKEIGQ